MQFIIPHLLVPSGWFWWQQFRWLTTAVVTCTELSQITPLTPVNASTGTAEGTHCLLPCLKWKERKWLCQGKFRLDTRKKCSLKECPCIRMRWWSHSEIRGCSGGAGLMTGRDDIEEFFQLWWFCDWATFGEAKNVDEVGSMLSPVGSVLRFPDGSLLYVLRAIPWTVFLFYFWADWRQKSFPLSLSKETLLFLLSTACPEAKGNMNFLALWLCPQSDAAMFVCPCSCLPPPGSRHCLVCWCPRSQTSLPAPPELPCRRSSASSQCAGSDSHWDWLFVLGLEHFLHALHLLICILRYDLRGLWIIWCLHSSPEGSPCLWL